MARNAHAGEPQSRPIRTCSGHGLGEVTEWPYFFQTGPHWSRL